MVKMQAKTAVVIQVLDGYKHGHTQLAPKGVGNLTFTGGKIHSIGGGWWAVSGYRSDNKDRDLVVQTIKDFSR